MTPLRIRDRLGITLQENNRGPMQGKPQLTTEPPRIKTFLICTFSADIQRAEYEEEQRCIDVMTRCLGVWT
jgi:hypothetical protein